MSTGFQNSVAVGGMQNNNGGGGIDDQTNNASDVKPVSIFSSDYKKHDDLKQMLDSNKENLKLDAMKRIVAMIAKGKNASDLFPAVVKNVVSKNVEIKKLVYVYLMRYAEEQQDLALLSISTFQRALKDPNQLIRASALRVLSSIRVPIIVTILMLAIKEAVNDMSPYVRKTAANAITKLYSLDPELKEDLVCIIEKLLEDKTILVAGSAIQAFEEVCPERIDLIHKNYRKLCNLLIDVDEWGQVIIINMLTRYARTQFLNPNVETLTDEQKNEKNGEKDDDDDEEKSEDDYDSKFSSDATAAYKKPMDPDHRLLLRVTKPLLQSRNSAVVMAVAQLYYYIAPKNEIQIISKPLVRLLRSYREVQIVVLKNIVSIAQKNNAMFQSHQKSFYVHSNDSIQIKLLKLEILTSLANESNISVLLREFQAYVLSHDKEFAAAAIHAIGRCASTIKEVTDTCLTGLVNLMSKKDETIVAESVVVIKRLLQQNPSKNGHIIKKMGKMADKVTVPMAKASILWIIGEYSDKINKIAPDVLRKMAKTFCDEENVVKLQIMNLGVKLYVTNQKQVALLVQYILNLAKYDQNYDIRDRARFLRALLINNEKCPTLSKHIKKILLAPKPAPVLQSIYKDSDQFQLGTLSHALSSCVNGYADLPDFPEVPPNPTVRNVELPPDPRKSNAAMKAHHKKSEKFYSDDEDDKSQSTEGADPSDNEDEEKSESEEESSEEESETETGSGESDNENGKKKAKKSKKKSKSESESEESNEDESDEEKSDASEEDEDDDAEKKLATSEESEEVEVKSPQNQQSPKLSEKKLKKKVIESSSSESDSEKSESNESEEDSDKTKSAPDSDASELDEKEQKKLAAEQQQKKLPVKQQQQQIVSKAQSQTKPSSNATAETKKESKSANKTSSTTSSSKPSSSKQPEVSLLDLDFTEQPQSNKSTNKAIGKNNLANTGLIQTVQSSVLSPSLAADLATLSSSSSISTGFLGGNRQIVTSKKEYELLNKLNGHGLQIYYRFPRTLNMTSNKMTTVELILTNLSNGDFNSLSISNKKLQMGMSMSELDEINLLKNATVSKQIGIDFNDTTQPAQFEITGIYTNDPSLGGTSTTKKWPNLSITCPVGELIQPGWSISESEFNKLQAKLKGMNEVNASVEDLTHAQFISKNLGAKLLEIANMCQIPSSQQDILKYTSLTSTSKTPLLLSLFFSSNRCNLIVNCDKIVLANNFIKEIKQQLLTSSLSS